MSEIRELAIEYAAHINEKNKRIQALEHALKEAVEKLGEATDAVIWMSGSGDFSANGIAKEGFRKVQPKIASWMLTLESARRVLK